MNRLIITIFIILGCFSNLYSQNITSKVLVGIIEDDRGELANWKKGPSKNRIIRPLFEKIGDKWELNISHSKKIDWTIAYIGQNIGTIKSHPNNDTIPINFNTHIPELLSYKSLTIKKASKRFSGWLSTAVNIPLVLVSKGGYKDPANWKIYKPTKKDKKLFKKIFRSEFFKVRNCDNTEMPLHDPWQYKDSEINITQCFKSAAQEILVGMFISGCNCGVCDGTFVPQLFLIKPDKTTMHFKVKSTKIYSNDDDLLSLFFLDAGDYDLDGKSEVIFFVSGYNEDGYAIFYDSFKKSVVWTTSYH